jgi:hypothetical protein
MTNRPGCGGPGRDGDETEERAGWRRVAWSRPSPSGTCRLSGCRASQGGGQPLTSRARLPGDGPTRQGLLGRSGVLRCLPRVERGLPHPGGGAGRRALPPGQARQRMSCPRLDLRPQVRWPVMLLDRGKRNGKLEAGPIVPLQGDGARVNYWARSPLPAVSTACARGGPARPGPPTTVWGADKRPSVASEGGLRLRRAPARTQRGCGGGRGRAVLGRAATPQFGRLQRSNNRFGERRHGKCSA